MSEEGSGHEPVKRKNKPIYTKVYDINYYVFNFYKIVSLDYFKLLIP